MKIILMTILLFSGCLAGEPRTKYFSKGLKVFTELIATDLEEDDFLEIMNYIGSRFHWHYCDKRIETLLDTTEQHEKEIQRLSAEQADNKEQLRSEISQAKLELAAECSNIANASNVRHDEIKEAMAKQYNIAQAFCDSETFESCLSGDCCFEETVTFKNMALGKTAWQSSFYYSDKGEATAAVDGNRNTSLASGKSCFHTRKEDHPWWMVDLGTEKHIGRVMMVNRGDGSYTRLRNVVVSVSLEKDGDSVTCGTFEGPGGKGQVITVTCSEEILGRFVKLTMNSRNFFHLCEVEVYRN